MSFNGLKGGDRIRFKVPAGLRIVNGRAEQDYAVKVGRVQRLLVFMDHVVVNGGGRFGTPYVVDSSNYVGRAGGGG